MPATTSDIEAAPFLFGYSNTAVVFPSISSSICGLLALG